jgi:ribose-phosphate pyrophosphokinase
MKINKYPDGTSYVNNTQLGEQVFRINSYEDLWHLNQFVDAFHSQHDTLTTKIRPNIIIPNLIDAQADRRFNKGESSGLKLVLKFLNGLDANFKIFHPHNQEVVENALENVQIIDNSEFIQKVLSSLVFDEFRQSDFSDIEYYRDHVSNISDKLILMSSDAGGFKPLMKLCDKIKWKGETFSAAKARSWDRIDGTKFVQQINRDDFGGKDILIIDDICVYGGTFKGLSKLLKERNCGKLYLAVSHMTVQNLGEDPVTNYFDKVFTTDSKYENSKDSWNYVCSVGTGKYSTQPLQNPVEVIELFR